MFAFVTCGYETSYILKVSVIIYACACAYNGSAFYGAWKQKPHWTHSKRDCWLLMLLKTWCWAGQICYFRFPADPGAAEPICSMV